MKKYQSYNPSGIEWISEKPENWTSTKLKYVSNIITGNTPSKNNEDNYTEGKFLWIKPDGLNEFQPTNDCKEKISEMGLSETRIVPPYSVLINGIGNIGKFGYSELPVSTNQQIHSIVFNPKKVDKRYGLFLISSLKDEMNRNSEKVVVSIYTKSKLERLEFIIPPIQEQEQIVNYLDEKTTIIDKLISTKQRKVELLKEKRTTLINQVITKGLNPNVKMKDSGIEWIGEIPERWSFVKLGHYTMIVRGGSPRPSGDPLYFDGDFIPWITVSEITNSIGKYITKTETMLTEEGMKQSRIIEVNTLLLSNSGATLGVPKITKIKGCINDGSVGFIKIHPKLSQDYLYHFLTTQTKLLREQQSGYGQPNLNIEIVSNIKLPLPPLQEQQGIVEYLDKHTKEIDDLVSMEQNKIELLKEYRQSLISEVITGKIKVV